MPSSSVRAILLRVQSDLDFYDRLQSHPDVALDGYDLSGPEREAILSSDSSLFRLIYDPTEPDKPLDPEEPDDHPPQPRRGPASPPDRQEVRETIFKITLMHNWINAVSLGDRGGLAANDIKRAKDLAQKVLSAERTDRTAMLLDLLKILDGRDAA